MSDPGCTVGAQRGRVGGRRGGRRPGAEHAEVKVGRVGFMDRALNLVQLEDGTELRTTDARLLRNITEGELVKVDFTYDGDKNVLNSIEPTTPETPLGAIPDAVGSGITSH